MTRHVKTDPRRRGKIGEYADKRDFFHEINYIMKVFKVPFHRVNILEDSPDGDHWIMIDHQWHGDLDDYFYECMDSNSPPAVFFMEDEIVRKWEGR